MPLDLINFRDAIASLDEAMLISQDPSLDDALETVIQAGVIKRFEFTYEMSWKYIKRWLEINVSPNTADGVTRRELFRHGYEHQLIQSVDQWMNYHLARNDTSHTYRKETADAVYAAIPAFLADARQLLAALEARND